MAIDIKSLFEVELNIAGKVYKVSRPSLGQQADYENALNTAVDNKVSVFGLMIKYLVGLGLPEEVAKSLNAEEFHQVVNEISSVEKKLEDFDLKLAKLVRFYSIDPMSLLNTPLNIVNALWKSIDRLEASEVLTGMTLADWPNIKSNKRSELHRKVYAEAFPEKMKTKAMNLDDLEKMLRRGLVR